MAYNVQGCVVSPLAFCSEISTAHVLTTGTFCKEMVVARQEWQGLCLSLGPLAGSHGYFPYLTDMTGGEYETAEVQLLSSQSWADGNKIWSKVKIISMISQITLG